MAINHHNILFQILLKVLSLTSIVIISLSGEVFTFFFHPVQNKTRLDAQDDNLDELHHLHHSGDETIRGKLEINDLFHN